ncbi:hypothetical protein EVAR_39932_1 [Eumeta japonica]|uniref:Mariner Mos1 transposase n=1 Tax=Eumeta variegata TaxID=151549 RepID=A0A4C1X2A4_EUMVA|nr:hypothetical protein EVAR_39932_1 [Eumeta japonica]
MKLHFLSLLETGLTSLKREHTNLIDDLRNGCPFTATTEDNISALRLTIETDLPAVRTNLGMSQVHKILHGHLAVRQLRTRWIAHNWTEAQKLCRVDWYREMMQRFAFGDSNAGYDIVTGDKSWIYRYDPESKRQCR